VTATAPIIVGTGRQHAASTRFETRLADESAARSAPCGDHDLGEPRRARRRWA